MAEKWSISGTYFEACNCETSCPCNFLSPPTEGECKVLIAWHIDEGHYGNVSLNGLNIAMAAHSPGHMLETKWKGALYFDEGASPEQTDSLTQIFSGQAGGHFETLVSFVGEVLGIASVPIEYNANGKERSMKVGDVATADIKAIEGQGGGDVTIEGLPLTVVPGYPAVASRSGKMTYQDHGYNWEFSGRSGLYSPFSYEG